VTRSLVCDSDISRSPDDNCSKAIGVGEPVRCGSESVRQPLLGPTVSRPWVDDEYSRSWREQCLIGSPENHTRLLPVFIACGQSRLSVVEVDPAYARNVTFNRRGDVQIVEDLVRSPVIGLKLDGKVEQRTSRIGRVAGNSSSATGAREESCAKSVLKQHREVETFFS
jgi:hypothetical protein